MSSEGSKVPGGLVLSGQCIGSTQHNSITNVWSQEIGHYLRVIENGGLRRDQQLMLMVINRSQLDWGSLLADLVDRELGKFRRSILREAMKNPTKNTKFILKLMIGGSQIKTWLFPNPELRAKFMGVMAAKFRTVVSEFEHGRLELKHPTDDELHGTLFTYEHEGSYLD